MKLTEPLRRALAALVWRLLVLVATGRATWSIVVVNTRTGEVCVASATCLSNLNLKLHLPVIVVGVGGGASQALLDFGATSRKVISTALHRA